jgi:serine/threonine-protein kinase
VPAISPDGKSIAYPGFTKNGDAVVFLRTLDELNPRPLPGSDAGIQATFSPDGQWLAFFGLGALKKVHIPTGSTHLLTNLNLPEGIDWGRDDAIVVSVDNRLVMVPASGGAPKPLTTLDTANGEHAQRGPHVLADGETVLFYSWRGSIEGSKIGVASMTTGAAHYLDIAGAPVGVVGGLLIYAPSSEALFAVPFDVRHKRVTGQPIRLSDPVPIVGNGLGRASVSRSGSLLYASGSALSDLVLTDLQGRVETVFGTPRAYSFPRFSPDGKRIAVSIGSASSVDVWIYDVAS